MAGQSSLARLTTAMAAKKKSKRWETWPDIKANHPLKSLPCGLKNALS